ncbi:SCP2 sterol-binding domain-containing protein [Micromonospora sp. NPDC047738]|uniref:SCP2 sterol-binding domain-containing protein n=1 Tax=unclassified Micromonospora TaxID=2617518 RepID=UPI0033DE0416
MALELLGGPLMSDVTRKFFAELPRQGRVLKKTTGTIRFDLDHDHGTDHWFISITNGDIRVTREEHSADIVIRTDNASFDRMVLGEIKPEPAWLRNELTSDGEFRLIILLERLFPESPGEHHPRAFTGGGGEQRRRT